MTGEESVEAVATFAFGDTTVAYVRDARTGAVGLRMVPSGAVGRVVAHRRVADGDSGLPVGWNRPGAVVDPLVHVKTIGRPYPEGFAQGRSMRLAPEVLELRLDGQESIVDGGATTVVTRLVGPHGYAVEHRLAWRDGENAGEVTTSVVNESDAPIRFELLTSFSLGGITPFAADDAANRLVAHRLRSVWSNEGRLDSQPLERLHVERSWAGHSVAGERFGQVGSMPVRGWFPFLAVEDVEAGVLWGAQVAWPGSWQLELWRRDDHVSISGGLGDREFGHWVRTVDPGETFTSPVAAVATVEGGIDDLCHRLTHLQHRAADTHPAVEADLPIAFNEFCTTWGDPTHDKVVALAAHLQGTPVRYLTIDAGWYRGEEGNWNETHGDWVPSPRMFPDGLGATAAAVRERGLVPGLWFEMETVGFRSTMAERGEHMLRRDGMPVTCGGRCFWDLRDAAAVAHLEERVIGQLRDAGFGYLKVDYNETIGIGVDHPDSLGEGLRAHIDAVQQFWRRLRTELPDLVIENCSSGGHRLEPSMMALSAQASFSDAHQSLEIPVIAADLHRAILPRQSQIWAVLKTDDTPRYAGYKLASTFLGRMCLSGPVTELDERRWGLALEAMDLYGRAAPIIKHGFTRRVAPPLGSYRHPAGWQAVVRDGEEDATGRALVVAHTFEGAPPGPLRLGLPPGAWTVDGWFHVDGEPLAVDAGWLVWQHHGDFDAAVALLRRA